MMSLLCRPEASMLVVVESKKQPLEQQLQQ